jgi:ABC-2 type transport system ATP-binding protein
MTAELVCARSVTVRFGDLTAVDSVSMSVRPGEVVGLLGANGAGKTTLLLTLLGLLQPVAGRVRLFDALPSPKTRKRVGYVPQTLGLYEDLTVRENWNFTCSAFGLGRPPLPAGVAHLSDQLVRALPLGEQRRVAFAVALSHQPALLVLDEPTSGVAPLGAARLWQEIRAGSEEGAGVLVTTHNMAEAEQCDQLVVMVNGRVAARGTVEDLVGSRSVTEVRCNDWRRAFRLLDAEGLVVQLRGDILRVPAPPQIVEALLGREQLSVRATVAPANLEEAFVDIVARGAEV